LALSKLKKNIFHYRRRMEEMKRIAEQERNERLDEREKKIAAGELVEDEDEAAQKGLFHLFKKLYFFIFVRNGTSNT
jgi:hypothetical protein